MPPFDGPDGYRLTCGVAAAAWRPRKPLRVHEWAEKYRRLSPKASAEPGPWRNDRIPFLVGIMQALDERDPHPMVVWIKSAQVGGSECGLNWLGYTIHQSPAPMLALFPSEKLGERWARGRLHTMIAESPVLRAIIPLGRRSDAGNTLSEKDFPGGKLYIGSANIPSDLASVPVARLLLDEVDRFPVELEDEGDPIEIALRRLATFGTRSKAYANSTPTSERVSRINALWRASDMRRYFVPCPHCGHAQTLKWSRLHWPEGRPALAAYACENEACAALIFEHSKTEMLRAGEWRAERPEVLDVAGFHINCLYTPIGLGDTWAQNAKAYDKARGKPEKLKVFTNTRLGETDDDADQKLEWEVLQHRAEDYPLRTIPAGVLLLTCGVDIQEDRAEAQIVGWSEGERATVIDYERFYGDPTRPELWAELDAYLLRGIVNAFGRTLFVHSCAVDAGYVQHDVVRFTRDRKRRNVIATKGMHKLDRPIIGRPTKVDVKYKGLPDNRGGELYVCGVSQAKKFIYGRISADGKPDVLPADRHIRMPRALPEDYFRGVAAEQFDAKSGKWVQTYDRNEPLDTLALNLYAAFHHSTRVDRMRENDWQALRDVLEPIDGSAPKDDEESLPRSVHGGFLPTSAIVRRS